MVVVNTPFGMGAALEFAKKFTTAANKKRIQVVRGGSKGLAQYAGGVLAHALPSELLSDGNGGDAAKSAVDMAQTWRETVMQNVTFLKNLDQLKIIDELS